MRTNDRFCPYLNACLLALPLILGGCSEGKRAPTGSAPALRINEVVSRNEGVWVDEAGETDDYIELTNTGSAPVDIGRYKLADASGSVALPNVTLAPKEVVLLWADDEPAQGTRHLGLKIDGDGESLTLLHEGAVVDEVHVPALAAHHAFLRVPDGTGEFVDCGWATPGRANGTRCGPPPTPELPADTTFAPYVWPAPWPPHAEPLALTELALRPAGFVEVVNTSVDAVDLSRYRLTVAPHVVGKPWPTAAEGTVLAWPQASLGMGEHVAVPVSEADLAAVAGTGMYEGVVSLWSVQGGGAMDGRAIDGGAVDAGPMDGGAMESSAMDGGAMDGGAEESPAIVDRQDFSFFPENAALTRYPTLDSAFRFCAARTRGTANSDCQPLSSRQVGSHVRALSTPGDFSALASRKGDVGESAVEIVIDMASGNVVALLDSKTWDIHYSFVREVIQGQPHLDRCDPAQQAVFNQGWREFSQTEYFQVEGRRYLLATLVEYAGANVRTLEYTPGDVISAEQMMYGFFVAMRHVPNPTEWALRPQSPSQVATMKAIEGKVPIVDMNAPFRGLTFQPLVPTVGYGTLRFVPVDAIPQAGLGPHDILVTDQVPYAIPLLAGLITETFQTPLAHVNVLSRGRGTPNMALKHAREDARIKPMLGKLVRLDVRGSDFVIGEADPGEALAFWESRKPKTEVAVPRLDTSVRSLVALRDASIADIPRIGSKAAQLAELGKVPLCAPADEKTPASRVPTRAFAIPFAYSVEHFTSSGAAARLARLRADPRFNADSSIRQQGLSEVQEDIRRAPVDPVLLRAVRERMALEWPGQKVRLRSSSNTEDLPQFNGAGLYTSGSIDAEASDADVADGIRAVWASLWLPRGYDEREYFNIDQSTVAMAVLVHEAFPSEKANGVAISRDILEPTRGDKYYINAQVGEAAVTNPAPGVTSDEFTYSLWRSPAIERRSVSSLNAGKPVLSDEESYRLACSLAAIHAHFRPLVDPEAKSSWFAMDIEFKLIGPARQLLIKQARPYSFGQEAPSEWCDF